METGKEYKCEELNFRRGFPLVSGVMNFACSSGCMPYMNLNLHNNIEGAQDVNIIYSNPLKLVISIDSL